DLLHADDGHLANGMARAAAGATYPRAAPHPEPRGRDRRLRAPRRRRGRRGHQARRRRCRSRGSRGRTRSHRAGHGRALAPWLTDFGLRSVGTHNGRAWLNGEPFVERLVLDQGYFPGGLLTAPSDQALRVDIEAAKGLGFNGARKHQKVEDPRWLYWADRLGFLVWDEMPSFQERTAEAERRLAAEWADVVRRDRDHPSVVAWVPANESFGLEHVE